MASMCKSIDVEVPVSTAYNQWTQFESFPRFMEGVESVVQKDDTTLHWKAKVGGRETEWDARITEQIPDVRIAWRSISGQPNSGAVDFHRIDDRTTRVVLVMETEPKGVVESVGDALGLLGRRIEKDLERFKEFIEKRGSETGAWRGEIPAAHNR
ncbi:MAG TPA: SRPBCC family protein [Candidatus Dormibacteraeota bacterium]|nr:SRPBCC family protein [Candidatus Dormibacteraeota bacterium]